jgi:hypothetical protein
MSDKLREAAKLYFIRSATPTPKNEIKGDPGNLRAVMLMAANRVNYLDKSPAGQNLVDLLLNYLPERKEKEIP